MREFLDVDAEMEAHAQALDDMYQRLVRKEDVVSSLPSLHRPSGQQKFQDKPVQRYGNGLEERKNAYAGKTTRQKYARDERYKSFRAGVWVCFLSFFLAVSFIVPSLGSPSPGRPYATSD